MKYVLPTILFATILAILYYNSGGCGVAVRETPRAVVVSAFDTEHEALMERVMITDSCTFEGVEYTLAQYEDKEIMFYMSGIGPGAAEESTRNTLENFTVELLVFSGIAGGVSDTLLVGDITVAAEWYELETTSTTTIGETLLVAADAITDVERVTRGVTADHFVTDTSVLPEHTDIVDMETYSVASVAAQYAVPFIAFRTVSDRADGTEKGTDFVSAAARSAEAALTFVGMQ